MKKLIAIELEIPDEYKEKEDQFMENLLAGLKRDNSDIYFYDETGKQISFQMVKRIFTGNYEFVDTIKGW